MNKNGVLIITNPLNHEGGVVNYYNLFFKYFDSKKFFLVHHSVGSRAYLFYYPILKRVLYPFYYVIDLLKYIFLLLFSSKIKIVQVSPSLIPVPLIRDGILVVIAKLLGKKVIVFYRGWKLPTLNKLKTSALLKKMFNVIFQKGTQQVVLANTFKKDLLELYSSNEKNIFVTKTAIDNKYIIHKMNRTNDSVINVLFLGRVQDLKGVNELIETICQLHEMRVLEHFKFTIVGHEDRLGYINELKAKLLKRGVLEKFVSFPGRVVGKEKFEMYASNDVYVLPSYTEGCPNSVLEALASGLFCITTPVGALSDLIEPNKNGILVKERNVSEIVNALLYVNKTRSFNDQRLENAKTYSKKFDIRMVTSKFEELYNEIIYEK